MSEPRAARTLLVGGGLGIAPLLGLAEALREAGAAGGIEALLGVRSSGDVFGSEQALEEFMRIGAREDIIESRRRLCELDIAAGGLNDAIELLEEQTMEDLDEQEKEDIANYKNDCQRVIDILAG